MVAEMTIQEASERSGVSGHTLRYYERAGLLDHVGRSEGGQRRFRAEDLERINFLVKMRMTGMHISQLREYIEAARNGEATAEWRRAFLLRHRASVASQIAELEGCLAIIDYKVAMYDGMMKGPCQEAGPKERK
jgi:DNA-binding transcriptional MerR regulator